MAPTLPGCAQISALRPVSAGCRRSAIFSNRSPYTRTSHRWRDPAAGPPTRSTPCFRGSLSVGRISAISFLAPIIVEELLAALRRIIREEGMSAILVEQNAKKILGVTDHAIIVERGAVVHAADSAALAGDRAALEAHLGVTDQGPRRGARPRQ